MNNRPNISASSKEFISLAKGITEKDQIRSTSHEAQTLREIIAKLRQEVLQTQAEKQKVQEQLQCLIYLVRKAWTGDHIAAVHVANIVGVAPPSMEKSDNDEELQAITKSRVLHNWARLSVGLLNKMYKDEENDLQRRQLDYLNEREGLLDDELHRKSASQNFKKKRIKSAPPIPSQKSNALDLLLRKGEIETMKAQQEKTKIEDAKEEMREKFKRKQPHSHKPHLTLESRDSVHREKDFAELSDLFVAPVVKSMQDKQKKPQDLVVLEDVSTDEDKQEEEFDHVDSRPSRKQNTRSMSVDAIPVTGSHVKTRPKSSIVKRITTRPPSTGSTKGRPFSAHVKSERKPRPSNQTLRNTHELDKIEKELKATTLLLQKRLCINTNGLV